MYLADAQIMELRAVTGAKRPNPRLADAQIMELRAVTGAKRPNPRLADAQIMELRAVTGAKRPPIHVTPRTSHTCVKVLFRGTVAGSGNQLSSIKQL